jgi:hypothetical protein
MFLGGVVTSCAGAYVIDSRDLPLEITIDN